MGVVRCLILGFLSIYGVSSVTAADVCEKHKTCSECILSTAKCAWCAANNFNATRCKTTDVPSAAWCPEPLQDPKNSINVDDVDNVDFNSKLGEVTQIKPQKYKITLRPGVPTDFKFSFKAASDYPVDLYFILDASSTMIGVKTTIEQQSENIYSTMLSLTNNIHLGMGTFIDKNALPYTQVLDSEKTYSFKNRLSLTNNAEQFRKAVRDTPFGSNYDEPEGGLDALAQVIRCKHEIGWRNESRKIIVFLTDGTYHSAGDGRVAGIFQPYDGQCYMKNNIYTKELEMDYPSVSIINKMASDEEMIVIFVVKRDKKYLYSHLTEAISGSKCITYDGDKIMTLLKDIYEEITKTIKIKVNIKSGHRNYFHINFSPDCVDLNEIDCSVKKGEEKHFNGTITLLKDFGAENSTIDIAVEGIKEKMTLDVQFIRSCYCESRGIAKSAECNEAGTLQCGICQCDPMSYGDKCACTTNSLSGINDNSTCIASGDDKLCSGHGSCICGKCTCRKHSPYEGQYCQFNMDNCPRMNGDVCNGHGRCEGEHCICTDGSWTGHACECPKWDKPCIGSNGKVCSKLGECKCGKCVCNRTAPWDARENQDAFCNLLPCPDCVRPQCDILQPCASCLHSGRKLCECEHFEAALTPYSISELNASWNICPDVSVEVGCYTRYMFQYDDDDYVIRMWVQTEMNCAESYYLYGGITLASLILIGVATLVVWKWLTDAQDRREFERFLQEHAEDLSAPCDNPTYRPASTTINNPAFRKPSIDVRN